MSIKIKIVKDPKIPRADGTTWNTAAMFGDEISLPEYLSIPMIHEGYAELVKPPVPLSIVGFISNPPRGKCQVKNIWVDPVTNKLVAEYDDTPVI